MDRARQALWLLAAAAVGFAVYELTCLWFPALDLPNSFQTKWAKMSEEPFAFHGPFPHRFLSPFLANLLGLDGERFFVFTRLSSVLLLALVFHVSRWRGARPVDAVLITVAVGCTAAIQIYKIQFAGYVDNLSYALFLLGMLTARHTWVFWPLFLVNLLNHEVAFFFTPWLLFVRRQAGARAATDLIAMLLVGGLYYGWRQFVGARAPAWAFDAGYFFENAFLPFAFAWLWLMAAVHWLLRFGPLLAVLCWHASAPRPDRERWHTVLVLASALGVFFFAYDVMRHSNLLFVPLVLASTRFLDGSTAARVVYAVLAFGTAAVFKRFGPEFDHFTNTVVHDCDGWKLILPENRFALGQHFTALHCMLGKSWLLLSLLAAEAVALLVIGRWLARRGVGGMPPDGPSATS